MEQITTEQQNTPGGRLTMTSFPYRRALILALLALLVAVGCRDHKESLPDELSEILGLKIDRPLEVVLASPQGVTAKPEDYQAITVVFNQPLKALTAEAPPIAQPFTLEPKVEGRFRWKGTATVSFEPQSPLPYGTKFKVTVPAGLKSPGGNELKSAYSFEFTTAAPHLESSIPADGATGHPPRKPLFLVFDQPVTPDKVKSFLAYESPAGTPAPQVRAVTEEELKTLNSAQEDEKRLESGRLVAVVTDDLAPDTAYTLKLKEGLTGVGPAPSNESAIVRFTTLGPFKWQGVAQTSPAAPEYAVEFAFSNSVNSKKLKEHLKVSPGVEVAVSPYDADDDWEDFSYYLPLEPNTTYSFTISGELTDVHGQKLGQDVTFEHKTGDRRPLVEVPEGIAVLEAADTLTIPMGVRNIDSLNYKMVRLSREQLSALLAQDNTNWLWGANKDWTGPDFTVNKTVKPDGARNEVSTYKLDLREVLGNKKFGFVYYQVSMQGGGETYERRGLAQVTNLGVSGKFSPENSVFFASSLDKAKPLPGVEATVLDAKGRPVWRDTTAQDGIAKAPGWSQLLTDIPSDSYAPQMFLFLKKGEDEAYVENNGFGEVSSWQFEVPFRWSASQHYLTSQVYSERGLYRPGEEVHLKGSLRDREKGEWTLAQVSKLQFEVKDSRDQKVESGEVKINEFGTFHHTVTLSEKAPTGAYRVDYSLDPETAKKWDVDARVAGATFRVEEFEAAQFEVDLTSPVPALVMGDKASFQVEAKWLFGAPMVDQPVTWSARVEPARYSSEEYPGYDFGPSYSEEDDRDDTKTLQNGKGQTDAKGLFKAELTIEGVPYKGDADLVLEGTITSANRRSVTGSKLLPLARGAYRIGLKPSSRFLPSGKAVDLQLVTLSPDGKPVSGKALKLELVRREWNSVKKTDVDGRFRWVTEVNDKVVHTSVVTSSNQPVTTSVTPAEAGYYIVRLSGDDDKKNTIVSESSFYAHGGGYVPWGRAEGDVIELVADKPKYKPGETAKILIKSPFEECTALITYERDLVLHSYTTTLKGSAPVIEVPLTDEHLPNLYVSVMLFRGRVVPPQPDESEDIGKPSFKIGVVDLPVAPDSKRLKVSVETDRERYGPNDEVVTKLKVTDAQGNPVRAELSLTAADVGVLNLIDFKTPDLFDTYYSSLPLAVRTAESRMDVIGQRSYGTKGEDEGGGGGYGNSYRKNFKFTAVWEPEVVTNAQGEAEVRFTMPENLTTFRVMATAITADTRCGSADKEIVLTKPLVLKPSAPAFARVGDKLQAGVLVVNGTEEGATVKIEAQSEGITAEKTEPREIFLKAGEEREVLFNYAPSEVGTATMRYSASMSGQSDAVEFSLPIELATQTVNLAHTGTLDDKSVSQPVEIPTSATEAGAQLQVRLASSILLGLENGVVSLLDYPYGCLEQRLSRLGPLLAGDELVERLKLPGWDKAKVKSEVQQNLDLIAGYADTNGGLKVWSDSELVSPFLTARAVQIASDAEKRGYRIKGAWLDKARGYLKSYLDDKATKSYQLTEHEELVCRAAALDALTRYGFSGKAYLNKLMDKRLKMPTVGKAYMLQAAYRLDEKASVETLAGELNNSLKIENATAYYQGDDKLLPWLYSDDVRDTGVALEAMLSSEQKMPLSDKVVSWLLQARNDAGTWGSTANNAAALSALVAYSKEFEGKDPSFTVNIKLDGKELKKLELDKKNPTGEATETLKPGSKSTIELARSGKGRLYYNVAASYQDKQPSPPVDEGLTVLRAITDLDGKAVSEFQGGKLYKVQLSVIAPALRRYVVLRDPIPAGFSVVKTDFATESSRLSELLSRGKQPSWQTFHRFEDYQDRVLLFADGLAAGEHTYEYLVRAQTPGSYLHPAAQAEEMYHPELFGRTAVGTVTIK